MTTLLLITTIIINAIAIASHVAAAPKGRPRVLAIALVVCTVAFAISRSAHADHSTITGYGVDAHSIEQVQSQLQALSEQRPSFVLQQAGSRVRLQTLSTVREARGNEPGLIVVQRVQRDRSREIQLEQEIDALKLQLAALVVQQRDLYTAAASHMREADTANASLRRDLTARRANLPMLVVAREQETPTPAPQGWLVALVLSVLALVCKRKPTVRPLELTAPQERFGAITPTHNKQETLMSNQVVPQVLTPAYLRSEEGEEVFDFIKGRVRVALADLGQEIPSDDYQDEDGDVCYGLNTILDEAFLHGNHPATAWPDDVDEWAEGFANQLVG